LGVHQKQNDSDVQRASAKPAYSIADLGEMGILSRTQAYVENRAGRLVLRKIGRKTIVLHDDLMTWLQNLPRKTAISDLHSQRARRRSSPGVGNLPEPV
jgi:hypothetical protein